MINPQVLLLPCLAAALPWMPAVAIALCSGVTACGGSTPTSPFGPTPSTNQEFPPPATHRVELPDGGELVLRFVEFHPARGGRLIPDQGAYVRVQWEMPRRPVLVSAAGDAWDGTRSLTTSFMSSAILFAFPVCVADPPILLSRTDRFGREAQSKYEFPRGRRSRRAVRACAAVDHRLASWLRRAASHASDRSDPGQPAHADGDRTGRLAQILKCCNWKIRSRGRL
jgi:hypothetical protein